MHFKKFLQSSFIPLWLNRWYVNFFPLILIAIVRRLFPLILHGHVMQYHTRGHDAPQVLLFPELSRTMNNRKARLENHKCPFNILSTCILLPSKMTSYLEGLILCSQMFSMQDKCHQQEVAHVVLTPRFQNSQEVPLQQKALQTDEIFATRSDHF